jgi:hypothetical protein
MLRLVSDEDVHDDIIRGLRRREPNLDIVRALDVGLAHTPDPAILEWAASHDRILLTGDLNTMVGFAWSRVQSGEPMPGVLALLETSALAESSTISCSSRCAPPWKRSKVRSCTFRFDIGQITEH